MSGGISEVTQEVAFIRFLRTKWLVFILSVLLMAYTTTAYSGGLAHLNLIKWIPLTLVYVGHVLIWMFLWFRLGRIAWLLIVTTFALQAISRAIASM